MLDRDFSWQCGVNYFTTYFSLPIVSQGLNKKTDLPVFSPYLLRRAQPTARLAYPPASSHFSNAYNQYRNFHLLSIAYAFRPGLRSRLTLRGRAFLRNPWAFDGRDSHSPCATYANILSCVVSSAPYGTPSSPTQCSSTGTWTLSPLYPVASVSDLSPGNLRRKVSRPVSYYALFKCMAASKPTSWLSVKPHILYHLI